MQHNECHNIIKETNRFALIKPIGGWLPGGRAPIIWRVRLD